MSSSSSVVYLGNSHSLIEVWELMIDKLKITFFHFIKNNDYALKIVDIQYRQSIYLSIYLLFKRSKNLTYALGN